MNVENIKPNLFLIGAPKAGTSAVAETLSSHPDIFLPEKKEPRFFDAHTFFDFEEDYPLKKIEEYLTLYSAAECYKYRLDASVFNMYSEASIDEIVKLNRNAKFLIVLRDPVESSVSMHKQRLRYVDKNMRELSENFMECWNLLPQRQNGKGYPKGCRNKFIFRYDLLYSYEKYIPYIKQKIATNNLLILFYDDLKGNYSNFYKEIFDFLGLPYNSISNKVVNESIVISNNGLIRLVFSISRSSYRLIKKIDKNGVLKERFISALYSAPKKIKVDSRVDDSVQQYFSETRQYLENLKK